ncbi:hypothetical protein TNCV_1159541 [Trichonephila clavipes]|nr:hypothetical protein TNCV_1159541 [Trichonephila clavipes]
MVHDGVPTHFSPPVRDWPDMAYLGYLIGRRVPVLWPPRLPNLPLLDIFSYGAISSNKLRKKNIKGIKGVYVFSMQEPPDGHIGNLDIPGDCSVPDPPQSSRCLVFLFFSQVPVCPR